MKEYRWKHEDEIHECDHRRYVVNKEKINEKRRIRRRLSKLVAHLCKLGIFDHEDLEAIRRLRRTPERISYITARVAAVQGQWEGRSPSEMFESLRCTGSETTRLYLGLNIIDLRSALGIHHVDYHVDLFKSWEVAPTEPATADSSSGNPIGRNGEGGP